MAKGWYLKHIPKVIRVGGFILIMGNEIGLTKLKILQGTLTTFREDIWGFMNLVLLDRSTYAI